MKHQRKGRKFGREKSQRKALLKGLLENLIMHEKITTTAAKAKEIQSLTDKAINKAKRTQAAAQKAAGLRELRNALSAPAVKKISGEFLKKFAERNSGYTRVIKLPARKSDSAQMAVIELVV